MSGSGRVGDAAQGIIPATRAGPDAAAGKNSEAMLAFFAKRTQSKPLQNGSNENLEHATAVMERQLRVLVVDDSKVMRGIIRKMLGSGDAEVLEAADGRQALDVLAAGPVDCIISDWNMPRMKGIDLLRRVRDDVALAATPFIMVTAEALAANIAEADAAKVSSYLTKPFTVEDLWRAIHEILPEPPAE